MSSLPKNSGATPKSLAATVKAQRVRVDVFSKSKATCLPSWMRCALPAFFCCLRSCAVSSISRISLGEKSFKVKKERPFRLVGSLATVAVVESVVTGTTLRTCSSWIIGTAKVAASERSAEVTLSVTCSLSRSSRTSGILIQRGPPRPRPSSEPLTSMTSTPASRNLALVT